MSRDLLAARDAVPEHPYLLGCLVPLVVLINLLLAFAQAPVRSYTAG